MCTIRDLNMSMQKVQKENFEVTEDKKMLKLNENTKVGEYLK